MSETIQTPVSPTPSPPPNTFIALVQMLGQAVTWFMNLPEATAKRLASGASKTWNRVKHLPTMQAAG